MNSKLKTLLKQAVIRSSQWTGSQPGITLTYDTLTQFAQLIVQECVSKIELEAAQYHEPTWAVKLVSDIREHFGVE